MENVKDVPKEKSTEVKEPLEKVSVKKDDYNVEIIRDYYGNVDPFYLSQKDPNFEYRFLRDDSKSGGKNISIKTGNLLFQKGGWQICPRNHLLKIGIKERELSPDNLLRRGDTILAFIPKDLFKEKQQEKIKRANEPMNAIKRLVKKGDASIGGKDIHETMKGIQTKEKLGM